nr:hypothetical protein [Ralstonia solanacearum]
MSNTDNDSGTPPRRIRRFLATTVALMAALHLYIGWRQLPDLGLNGVGWTAGVVFLCLPSVMVPLGMAARFLIRPTELADHVTWFGALLMGLFSSLLVLTLLRDVALLLLPEAWRTIRPWRFRPLPCW